MRFAAPGQHTVMPVALAADTVHTIVVLDHSSGLKVDAVTDAVGSQAMPKGAVSAGFGGDRTTPARQSRAMAGDDRGRGSAGHGGACPVPPPGVTPRAAQCLPRHRKPASQNGQDQSQG